MKQYLSLLRELVEQGNQKGDRTGTGTLSKFGHQLRFNLQKGFPLVTTKTVNIKNVIHELLWFIHGDTDIKYLKDNKVNIWDDWATETGEIGPMYGKQWRDWRADGLIVDQLQGAINTIRSNPNSRRICVSTWNVTQLPNESISPQVNVIAGFMALAPCHCFFQFYVYDKQLSCQVYQRSCDTMLGVPYNIASYALLTHMIARICKLQVGDLIWTGGDVHLYSNHTEQAKVQLDRKPFGLPTLHITGDQTEIDDFKIEDFRLINYMSHPAISAPRAI